LQKNFTFSQKKEVLHAIFITFALKTKPNNSARP